MFSTLVAKSAAPDPATLIVPPVLASPLLKTMTVGEPLAGANVTVKVPVVGSLGLLSTTEAVRAFVELALDCSTSSEYR